MFIPLEVYVKLNIKISIIDVVMDVGIETDILSIVHSVTS